MFNIKGTNSINIGVAGSKIRWYIYIYRRANIQRLILIGWQVISTNDLPGPTMSQRYQKYTLTFIFTV